MRLPRISIWISGTGSNLAGALEASGNHEIGLVVSSKKAASGILKARRAGVEVVEFLKPWDWQKLNQTHREKQIDFIFLAGFMKIVPPSFINEWKGKMVNIHPSLLPKYPGLESIRRGFKKKDRLGATIHKVVSEVDAGEKIVQRSCQSGVTLEKSEFLVHVLEQQLGRKVFRSWNLM